MVSLCDRGRLINGVPASKDSLQHTRLGGGHTLLLGNIKLLLPMATPLPQLAVFGADDVRLTRPARPVVSGRAVLTVSHTLGVDTAKEFLLRSTSGGGVKAKGNSFGVLGSGQIVISLLFHCLLISQSPVCGVHAILLIIEHVSWGVVGCDINNASSNDSSVEVDNLAYTSHGAARLALATVGIKLFALPALSLPGFSIDTLHIERAASAGVVLAILCVSVALVHRFIQAARGGGGSHTLPHVGVPFLVVSILVTPVYFSPAVPT